jgi:methylase of polypeptide subunit release factors
MRSEAPSFDPWGRALEHNPEDDGEAEIAKDCEEDTDDDGSMEYEEKQHQRCKDYDDAVEHAAEAWEAKRSLKYPRHRILHSESRGRMHQRCAADAHTPRPFTFRCVAVLHVVNIRNAVAASVCHFPVS